MDFHIFQEIQVSLSIKDRIRVLFGAKITIETKMLTNYEPIEVIDSKSSVRIGELKAPKRIMGYELTGEP